MTTLRRNYGATYTTREEGGAKRIVGLPVVIGRFADLGCFREVIEPGALDGTDLKDVLMLVNHREDMVPLARSRRNNGSSTMTLSVTADGLEVDAALDVDGNAEAAAVYSAIGRGDIDGMSFAFTVSGEAWEDLDTDYPTRRITAIERIFEVSPVNHPAYPDTSVSVRDKEALEGALRALECARATSAPVGAAPVRQDPMAAALSVAYDRKEA